MPRSSLRFLLLAFVIPPKYFAHGAKYSFFAGGLIWSRNLNNFIPIANVTAFGERHQKLLSRSRELETHNFRRSILKLAYYEEKNIFAFEDNDTRITGVCGELWNMLSNSLNFTLVARKVGVSHYGVRSPNGSYDGLVGMLMRNEIQVIPRTGYYVSESRVMDYTTPIWDNRYRMYIRPQFTSDTTWMFNMFSRHVWGSILLLFVLISVLGYTAQKISVAVSKDNKVWHNFHDHLFYTFGTFCCQGYIPDTLYRRTKVLGLTKKVFAWLLLIVLSSHLISYMTNRKAILPFENLETLLNSTKYNLVIFKGSMVIDKFNRTANRVATRDVLAKRVVTVNTPDRMYEKGCWSKRKYAILESEDRQRAYGRFVCKLVPVGRSYFPTWVASGVAKGFKYKRTIDIGILKLNEFGLTDGMKDRWMESATVKYEGSPVNSVTFDQVVMLFMILCVGVIASVTIFVFENAMYVYNCNRRGSRSRRNMSTKRVVLNYRPLPRMN